MIRELKGEDLDKVMRVWLEANAEAHHFIPRSYWEGQWGNVREAIPESEVYVYEKDGEIMGFVGLSGNYIAGIFVAPGSQSAGIGKQLLDYAKGLKPELHLHVYSKNRRAVRFYLREGFSVQSEGLDTGTGEKECLMVFGKK